jgi:hypothetical protein
MKYSVPVYTRAFYDIIQKLKNEIEGFEEKPGGNRSAA